MFQENLSPFTVPPWTMPFYGLLSAKCLPSFDLLNPALLLLPLPTLRHPPLPNLDLGVPSTVLIFTLMLSVGHSRVNILLKHSLLILLRPPLVLPRLLKYFHSIII